MKIINPLYDLAFKYLMENNKLAKKILSVILDEEIAELELSQQETALADKSRGLTLLRLDFKALIRNPDGTQKIVLIELQKSKFPTDIIRFRNYLGASYLSSKRHGSHPLIEEPKSLEYPSALPIIAIYILGYNVKEIPYLAVTVNKEVINSVSKERLDVKSDFIEMLHHRSHIIQVKRLPVKQQTRLEKFVMFFNQAWCTENRFILDLQNVPQEFSDVASYLQRPVVDEDFRRSLEAEEELDIIFGEQAQRYLKMIREAIDDLDEERKMKSEIIMQKEEECRQKEEERRQKEEALVRIKETQTKLARQMKKYGAPIQDIINETGLNEDEIARLTHK